MNLKVFTTIQILIDLQDTGEAIYAHVYCSTLQEANSFTRIVRVFSDVLVAFLYFDICRQISSGKYQNMEKPLKHQRMLGLSRAVTLRAG